jgi:hypothetical protein
MEERILKIITNRINSYLSNPESQQKENAAKEITSMVMEFIEWFTGEKSPVSIMYGNQPERFATTKRDYTIKELFQYWFDNIKNKKS